MKKIFLIIFTGLIVKQILWMIYVPVWQFPDEQAHFAQIQNIAEIRSLQSVTPKSTSREIFETEVILGTARDSFGNNKFTYHPNYNISYTDSLYGLWEREILKFPPHYRTEYMVREATGYPPLYYIFGASIYTLFYSTSIFTRLFAVRFANIIYYLIIVWTTYLIGKKLFGRNRILTASLVFLSGFHPMFSFVSGGVNSDTLFTLLFTISIYISLCLLEKVSFKHISLGIFTYILATWTKPQAPLIFLVFLYPFIFHFLKYKKYKLQITITCIILTFIFLYTKILGLIRGDQILPELPSLQNMTLNISPLAYFKSHLLLTYRQILPWYWGIYRWLSLSYHINIYRLINIISGVAILGLLKYLISNRSTGADKDPSWGNILFLFFVTTGYYLGITVYDFLFYASHGFSLGLQGRYFFPALVAQMALLVVGIYYFGRLFNQAKLFVMSASLGMIILHSYAFLFLVNSYYPLSNLSHFFILASQYKPEIFKGSVLILFSLIGFLSTISLIFIYIKSINTQSYD